MSDALVGGNLLTWSLQTGLLVMVAAVMPFLLGLAVPKARLAYWQLVLVACLALPLLRPWERQTVFFTQVSAAHAAVTGSVVVPEAVSIPLWSWVLMMLVAGIAGRFVWLLTGFWRMRRYRLNSIPLKPLGYWGAEADLRISEDVQSPVTFGFLMPVVLLPASFVWLDEVTQEAILCHEIQHVRRKDWLFTLAEEAVRTVLWFHPAIWWVLGEIQLAREQTVDREVIAMTRSRDEYVDALLAVAGANPPINNYLAQAPLFLRRRHLKQRVISILKEGHMSKTRSVSALAASLLLLAGSCWLITGAVPLYGAPQTIHDGAGVGVETNGTPLLHRNAVMYPADALSKRIEGLVTVQVKLDERGNVADASVLSGPEELRKAVLQSVLNWHFAKSEANALRQVGVKFELDKVAMRHSGGVVGAVFQPNMVLKSVEFAGSSPQGREEVMAKLPIHAGDTVTPEAMSGITRAVREYDEHLSVSPRMVGPGEMQIVIAGAPDTGTASVSAEPPKAIRVGANVMQANLANKVNPVYPPLAKAARVQGTVQFEATIGADGSIRNLHLTSGPPLLVQAAMQAVQQWAYKPTLLNGNPVEVITTIDVNFTLEQ